MLWIKARLLANIPVLSKVEPLCLFAQGWLLNGGCSELIPSSWMVSGTLSGA